MPCRSTLSKPSRPALALALAALVSPFANAAPKPMGDAEMSGVRGADGSILAGIQGAPTTGQNALSSGLAAGFSSSTGATLLTPAEFAASLAGAGLSLDAIPGYHGELVAQTVVDARPVSFTFTLSDVLQATTGLQSSSSGGASFGAFAMNNFDARGTVLWVWQHH